MNDDFLYKFHDSPRREFAASLYERISKPMKTTSRTQSFRAIAVAFSMVMLIGAALIFSPTTRALADSIIRQFGSLIFVQGTPEPKPLLNETTGQQVVDSSEKKDSQSDQADQAKKQQLENESATANYAQDASAASELAGFAVLAPAYLPEGYLPGNRDNAPGEWTILHQNGGVRASISYEILAQDSFLTIEQIKEQSDQTKTVESSEIVDVSVRGQPGVWMPDAPRKSILVWDENGITYFVISNSLSLDEVLKVAESLGK